MPQIKVNQETYARLFRMLLDDPVTTSELVEETGLHRVTAQSLMRALKKHGVVHVCAWEPDKLGRDRIAVYKLGAGRDRPRRRLSDTEKQARHRAKKMSLDTLLNPRGRR